jgi:hypothetical protein
LRGPSCTGYFDRWQSKAWGYCRLRLSRNRASQKATQQLQPSQPGGHQAQVGDTCYMTIGEPMLLRSVPRRPGFALPILWLQPAKMGRSEVRTRDLPVSVDAGSRRDLRVHEMIGGSSFLGTLDSRRILQCVRKILGSHQHTSVSRRTLGTMSENDVGLRENEAQK